MRKRIKKGLLVAALAIPSFFGLVEILAWSNIAAERNRRSYLGDKLFTQVAGNGTPIVFMAGLQGSTRYWGEAFQPLAATRRLIYVDLYGFGQSPWPLEEPTLEDHIAWLRRTLVAHGATRDVTLVAHSFGGIVAAYYAARYPAEVAHVYLLGAPVFESEGEARKRIRDMSQLAALFALNPVIARETCLVMGAFRPFFRRLLPYFGSKTSSEVLKDAVLHDWPSINGAIRNILLTKPLAVPVGQLGAKVTFVHGSADRVTPLPQITKLANKSAARVVVLPVDHQGYVTEGRSALIQLLNAGASDQATAVAGH